MTERIHGDASKEVVASITRDVLTNVAKDAGTLSAFARRIKFQAEAMEGKHFPRLKRPITEKEAETAIELGKVSNVLGFRYDFLVESRLKLNTSPEWPTTFVEINNPDAADIIRTLLGDAKTIIIDRQGGMKDVFFPTPVADVYLHHTVMPPTHDVTPLPAIVIFPALAQGLVPTTRPTPAIQ